eukprot:11203089-Lingulodinium_polyedra.AAC.2
MGGPPSAPQEHQVRHHKDLRGLAVGKVLSHDTGAPLAVSVQVPGVLEVGLQGPGVGVEVQQGEGPPVQRQQGRLQGALGGIQESKDATLPLLAQQDGCGAKGPPGPGHGSHPSCCWLLGGHRRHHLVELCLHSWSRGNRGLHGCLPELQDLGVAEGQGAIQSGQAVELNPRKLAVAEPEGPSVQVLSTHGIPRQ